MLIKKIPTGPTNDHTGFCLFVCFAISTIIFLEFKK